MADPIRVLVCEDHTLFRELLCMALAELKDILVVGEAGTVAESIARARETSPDVIVMDIRMKDGSGIDATAKIKEFLPHANVVMMTGSEEEEDLVGSIKAGASGYLLKTIRVDEIPDAIRAASKGTAVISPSIAPKLLSRFAAISHEEHQEPAEVPNVNLTERQLSVLRLIAKGYSDKEIAEELQISEGTVRTHVQRILQKFEKQSRIEAVLSAVRRKMIPA